MRTSATLLQWLCLLPALVAAGGSSHGSSSDAGGSNAAGTSGSSSEGDHGDDRHQHGHPQWHVEDFEYYLSETLCLIPLIVLAIGFELIYHEILHRTHHSYHFGRPYQGGHYSCCIRLRRIRFHLSNPDRHCHHGECEHHEHGTDINHFTLWQELVRRAGGEFMILGWLAFVIYLCNKLHFFDHLPTQDIRDDNGAVEFRFPDSASAWLHLMEDTHMRLFFAMVIYFFSISVTLHTYNNRLYMLDHLQQSFREHGAQVVQREDVLANIESGLWNAFAFAKSSTNLLTCGLRRKAIAEEYVMLRDYFIDEIVSWREHRWDDFDRVRQAIRIKMPGEPDEDDDTQAYSQYKLRNSEKVDVAIKTRRWLQEHFAFSTYLAVIIEESLSDVIQMPTRTWLILLCQLALFATCFRLHVSVNFTIMSIVWVIFLLIITGCSLAIVALRRADITYRQKARLACKDEHELVNWTSARSNLAVETIRSFGQRHSLEHFAIRAWEFVRFNAVYVISWTLMDICFGWKHYSTTEAVLYTLSFVLDIFLLVWSGVIDAYMLMALPPYVDYANLRKLLLVLKSVKADLESVPEIDEDWKPLDTIAHTKCSGPGGRGRSCDQVQHAGSHEDPPSTASGAESLHETASAISGTQQPTVDEPDKLQAVSGEVSVLLPGKVSDCG